MMMTVKCGSKSKRDEAKAHGGKKQTASGAGAKSGLWLRRTDLAALLGVSAVTVDRNYGDRKDLKRGEKSSLRYNATAVVSERVEEAVDKAVVDSVDGEIQGAKTPMAEKWRGERYLMARMERLEKEGQLVDRGAVRCCFELVAGHLRRAGEQMRRQGLAAAAGILDSALDESVREVALTLGKMQMESESD